MPDFDDDPITPAPTTAVDPGLPDPNTDDAWTSTGDTPDPAPVAAATPDRDTNGTFKKSAKPRDNPNARVKDATAEAARFRSEADAARKDAADARAELDRLRATPKTDAKADAPKSDDYTRAKPKESDVGEKYQTYADFIEDLDDWKYEQRQAGDARARLETQARERLTAAHERAEAAATTYPDWNDVRAAGDAAMIAAGFVNATDGTARFPDAMWQAVLHSDSLGDIVHYLGSHPEECVQLARDFQSLPASAATAVQKVLERLVAPGAVARPDSARSLRPSNAKAPINRVSGTASATPVDPDDLDFGPEYLAAENKRERERRQASRF